MRRRLDVAMRVLVAVPGGYACTALAVMLLARLLPGTALHGSLTATMLSFGFCAAGVIASFAARDGLRAGLWLVALSVIAGAGLALTVWPA